MEFKTTITNKRYVLVEKLIFPMRRYTFSLKDSNYQRKILVATNKIILHYDFNKQHLFSYFLATNNRIFKKLRKRHSFSWQTSKIGYVSPVKNLIYFKMTFHGYPSISSYHEDKIVSFLKSEINKLKLIEQIGNNKIFSKKFGIFEKELKKNMINFLTNERKDIHYY